MQLQNMKSGYGVMEDGLRAIPIKMDEFLEMRVRNRSSSLLYGEGDSLVMILTDTFKYVSDMCNYSPEWMVSNL
jgi:hypothetical protein